MKIVSTLAPNSDPLRFKLSASSGVALSDYQVRAESNTFGYLEHTA